MFISDTPPHKHVKLTKILKFSPAVFNVKNLKIFIAPAPEYLIMYVQRHLAVDDKLEHAFMARDSAKYHHITDNVSNYLTNMNSV